jgi:guanylate kinase
MSNERGQRADRRRRRGLMLVVSSPSGAGKTTLTRRLLAEDANLDLSISVTTRPAREGEEEGIHYHFISPAEFGALRDAGGLLESAEVFGHLYGTPRAPVEKAVAAGRDVLFDIDWQGAAQLREHVRDDVVCVFVLPPSATELMSRLVRRGQDQLDAIGRRMDGAAREVAHWAEYDYVIVNQDLATAHADLVAILRAERLRCARQVELDAEVGKLRADLEKRLAR